MLDRSAALPNSNILYDAIQFRGLVVGTWVPQSSYASLGSGVQFGAFTKRKCLSDRSAVAGWFLDAPLLEGKHSPVQDVQRQSKPPEGREEKSRAQGSRIRPGQQSNKPFASTS